MEHPRPDRSREVPEVVAGRDLPGAFDDRRDLDRRTLDGERDLVQAAVAYHDSKGAANSVQIVLGHVAPTPIVSKEAAEVIEGKEVTEETAAAAGKAAAKGAKPLSHTGYKVRLIEVAVKRALLLAAGQKKYWEA